MDGSMMDEFSLLAKHLSFVISLGNMGESVSPVIRGKIVAGKNKLCVLNMVAEKLRNPFQVPPKPCKPTHLVSRTHLLVPADAEILSLWHDKFMAVKWIAMWQYVAEVKIFLCFVPLGLSKWIQMGSFILEHLRSFSATWRVILCVQKKSLPGRLAGKYSLCFPALDSSTKIHLRFTSRKNLFFCIIWVPLVLDLWKCMAPSSCFFLRTKMHSFGAGHFSARKDFVQK